MSNINIIGTSGIGHGETLPNDGRRHGEIFELIPDTLSKPKLYTWNSITKKWDILSGDGSSEGGTYTNVEPTISALGGIGVGNTFEEKTMQEMFDMLLYPYMSPSISLSTNPNGSVREYGNNIGSIVLNANVTKKSNDIVKIEYYKNGSLIHINGMPSSESSTDSYTDSTGINNTTTYIAKVYDDKSSNSSSITHTYVYPYYYGVGLSNLIPTQIKLLTKNIKTKSNTTITTSPNDEVYYFACPKSYGLLSDILDQNGFSIIGDYMIRTEDFICLDGTTQQYYVYEFAYVVNSTDFTISYKY